MKKFRIISLLAALLLVPVLANAQIEVDLDFVDSADSSTVQSDKTSKKAVKPSRKDYKYTTQEFSDSYLDTVNVKKKTLINDYSMIGVQYGAGVSRVMWNPPTEQGLAFEPYNVGIMYTRYGKMFNFMPYFGFQLGVFYTQEGFQYKEDDDGNTASLIGTGESAATMKVIEVPLLAHCHIDFWKMKILVNIGCYGGYRLSIDRSGDYVSAEYEHKFTDYNNRVDFGIKGGVGFGFVFDPVEIHFQAMYKHSFSSLYQPDYYSTTYYRYAYPQNLILSVGLHFQITKRTGMTSKMLRQQAYDSVYGTVSDNQTKK